VIHVQRPYQEQGKDTEQEQEAGVSVEEAIEWRVEYDGGGDGGGEDELSR
jgi:hypothetical protein